MFQQNTEGGENALEYTENNIFQHLIAECQNCHGIFISAMIASDQPVESINGVCPLCSKETEQFFIGIIKPYPEEEEEI